MQSQCNQQYSNSANLTEAKRPRGHPKGEMDPLGSSDHRMLEVAPLPPRGRAAEGCECKVNLAY